MGAHELPFGIAVAAYVDLRWSIPEDLIADGHLLPLCFAQIDAAILFSRSLEWALRQRTRHPDEPAPPFLFFAARLMAASEILKAGMPGYLFSRIGPRFTRILRHHFASFRRVFRIALDVCAPHAALPFTDG